jgi:hypothetical protein
MVALHDKMVLGGSFQTAENISVNHVCEWDGDGVTAYGGGVDGAVNSLSPYMGGMLVGGAFTRASFGGRSVATGGLAWWYDHQWRRLGDAQVLGVVFALLANSSKVYVAGRFSSLGTSVPVRKTAHFTHTHTHTHVENLVVDFLLRVFPYL